MYDPKRQSSGDLLTAEAENQANEQIKLLGKLRGGKGIKVRASEGGFQIAATPCAGPFFFLQLDSTANGDGGYSWVEETPAPLRTWVELGNGGDEASDPAYPLNPDTSLTADGRTYPAWRSEATGEVLFLVV